MKMIKNTIKLLGLFAVFCVATLQNKADAIKIADVPSSIYTINTTTNNYQSNVLMNNNWRFFFSDVPFATYLKSYSSVAIQFGSNPSHAQFTWVKASKDNSNLTVQLWHEGIKDWVSYVFPVNWLTFTFKNWETALLDNIFFWHDSVILYDDSFRHTLQYKWSIAIEYVVFLVDPLQSTTSDNFWLIDFLDKKAYSTTLWSWVIYDLFFWQNFTNYNFQSINYEKSYSLSQTTWSVWFPSQMNMYQKSISYTPWHFDNDVSFVYSLDPFTIQPEYWTNDNNNLNSNKNYFNAALIDQYNDCVNKWENLRKALHLAALCKYEDTNTERENIIYNTWFDYTWTAVYCQQLDSFAYNLYNTYSWNWASGVFSYDVNLQDYTLPINQLIFAWFFHSVVVWSNWQISWLPNWNDRCAAYTVSNFNNNNKSTIEIISDDLNAAFWSWIAKQYADTINSSNTFSWLLSAIKDWTSWFFADYLFDPYTAMFNSWLNEFQNKFWFWSCENIQNWFWGLQLWNYALYIVAVVIIFIFIIAL